MKRTTFRTTVAALALTAGAAFAADEVTGTVTGDVTAEPSVSAGASTETTGADTMSTKVLNAGEAAVDATTEAASGAVEAVTETATDTAQAVDESVTTNAEADASVSADTDNAVTSTAGGMSIPLSGMVAGDLLGLQVIAADGAPVGRIASVVRSENGIEVVIGIGGFLGFGRHDVAVPVTELSQLPDVDGAVRLSGRTESDLNEAPEFDATGAETLEADASLEVQS